MSLGSASGSDGSHRVYLANEVDGIVAVGSSPKDAQRLIVPFDGGTSRTIESDALTALALSRVDPKQTCVTDGRESKDPLSERAGVIGSTGAGIVGDR